jgi:hypothetical protein
MVITFDFDDTLLWFKAFHDEDGDFVEMKPIGRNPYVVPRFEQALQNPDVSVYIVTSRGPGSLGKTLKQLDALGFPDFPADRIRFTDGELKRDTLAELGSQLHYDDDPVELENLPTGCKGVLAPIHPSWLTKGIDRINEGINMRITEGQLRRIIRQELNEMGMKGDVKGATFSKDPVTGKWVTAGEDFPGEGGRLAAKVREPRIKSVGDPAFLRKQLAAGKLGGHEEEELSPFAHIPGEEEEMPGEEYSEETLHGFERRAGVEGPNEPKHYTGKRYR